MANLTNASDERTLRKLAVLTQPTALAQPRERPLHGPTDRQPHPTLGPLGPTHDRQIPAGIRRHPLVQNVKLWYLAVGKHALHFTHRLPLPGHRREQLRRRFGVIHVRRRHQNGQQQTHAVYDDMAFATIDVLGVVPTALLATRGGIDRLTVDAGRGARRVGLLGCAHFLRSRSWMVSRVPLCRHWLKYFQTVLLGGKSLGR